MDQFILQKVQQFEITSNVCFRYMFHENILFMAEGRVLWAVNFCSGEEIWKVELEKSKIKTILSISIFKNSLIVSGSRVLVIFDFNGNLKNIIRTNYDVDKIKVLGEYVIGYITNDIISAIFNDNLTSYTFPPV